MNWFGPIRRLLLANLDALVWLVPALTVASVVALLWLRRRSGFRTAVLISIAGIAAWAQVFLGRRDWWVAGVLYGLSAIGLCVWLLAKRGADPLDAVRAYRLPGRTEWVLFAVVILVAAFARFYRFDEVPYGIEGDEAKWSVQVAAETFAHQARWDSDYRHEYVPYTYWVETLFYRLMGISVRTARWQVAFLSVIASALFYFIARRILGPPGALVSTFLLAVSIADISASRLSHVESQIKLPLMVSMLGLVYAVDTHKWYWYLLSGIGMAAGLLTFDTYFMVPAVIMIWLVLHLLIDKRISWRPSKSDLLGKPGRLILAIAPVIPVVHGALFYITTRRADHNKSVASLARAGYSGVHELLGQLGDNLSQTLVNFSYQRWGDFLLNRDGPVVNAVLIPLAAIGLVYMVVRWRRGQNGLVPLWFVLLFFPAAVFFGSPYIRVFYPAFPAIYLMAAAGILLVLGEVFAGLAVPRRSAVLWISCVLLLTVGANNLYGYLNEVEDPGDRIARRELADQLSEHVVAGERVYIPYMPGYDDTAEWEREFLQFVVWGKAPIEDDSQYYRLVPYVQLLRTLSIDREDLVGATVVFDRGIEPLAAERQAIIAAVEKCYSGATVDAGQRYDAIVIPSEALLTPSCDASVEVRAEAPNGMAHAGEPLEFRWSTIPENTGKTALIEIARRPQGVVWVEAEDLFFGPSWYVEGRFAPDFGGRGYLGDWYGASDVSAVVPIPSAGRYVVWARTHRRVTQDMPFAIVVNDQRFPAAMHTPDQFDQWLWERLGEVQVDGNSATVTLHRDYDSSRHMSVFLDALVFSADLDYDPANGLWPSVFLSDPFRIDGQQIVMSAGDEESTSSRESTELNGTPWPVQVIVGKELIDAVLLLSQPDIDLMAQDVWRMLPLPPTGTISGVDLSPGTYRWRVKVFDDDYLIGPTGEIGVWSDWADFTLL